MADQTQHNRQFRYKYKEPSKYNVIFHNDDITTMEFVVSVLVHIFNKDEVTAENLMLTVHNDGSAVAGTYSKDIAESKKDKTIREARKRGYPLQLTVEKEK